MNTRFVAEIDLEVVKARTKGELGICPLCGSDDVNLLIRPETDYDELAYIVFQLECNCCSRTSGKEYVEIPRIWRRPNADRY